MNSNFGTKPKHDQTRETNIGGAPVKEKTPVQKFVENFHGHDGKVCPYQQRKQ